MNLKDAIYILKHVPVSYIVDAVRSCKNCSEVWYEQLPGTIIINDGELVSEEDTINLAIQLCRHAKNLGN